MSMWDEAASAAEKHTNQGGLFLRLSDDGDKAVVAFCGEPQPTEVVWTGEGYEPFNAATHTDKKPSLRVKINVFNVGESKMQIWDMNANTFKSLLQLRAKYGLDKKTFEICRNGKKGDPKTTYLMLPEGDIDAGLAERIRAERLLDLNATGSETSDGANGAAKNRELLLTLCKSLPAALLQKFCEHYGPKIRDIPDEKLVDALATANSLAKKSETKTKVDPFE